MTAEVIIVARPKGEAPEWVRDAWIGLALPLAIERKHDGHGFGVLTGPHTLLAQWWAMICGKSDRVSGYLVDVNVAVELLAKTEPDAAEWWREYAPHLLSGRQYFNFDDEACSLKFTNLSRRDQTPA